MNLFLLHESFALTLALSPRSYRVHTSPRGLGFRSFSPLNPPIWQGGFIVVVGKAEA